MKCQWCGRSIEFSDCGMPCSGITGSHRPNNRHAPAGDQCPCGRAGDKHRVAHQSKGEPCSSCGLPASCHSWRPTINLKTVVPALRARDGWMCALCTEPFDEAPPSSPHARSVTVDHVVTVWRRGSKDLSNLRLAHRICNMKRGGDGVSPAQQRREETAVEGGRLRLGAKGKGMTAGEVWKAVAVQMVAQVAKRRSDEARESDAAPRKESRGTHLRPRRR